MKPIIILMALCACVISCHNRQVSRPLEEIRGVWCYYDGAAPTGEVESPWVVSPWQ